MEKDSKSGQARPLPLSLRLAQIVEQTAADRLSFSELAAQLHARAWGGLLLIFAAINVIPLPPGTSSFFAIPLLIVSAQMVAGRETPWFPSKIDRRGVKTEELTRLISKMGVLELKVERIFKPRLAGLTGPLATRLIGVACFVLALVAAIPVPLFHMAPAAAILLFGLALIYRDGLLVILACCASLLSILIDLLVIGSGLMALKYAAARFGL